MLIERLIMNMKKKIISCQKLHFYKKFNKKSFSLALIKQKGRILFILLESKSDMGNSLFPGLVILIKRILNPRKPLCIGKSSICSIVVIDYFFSVSLYRINEFSVKGAPRIAFFYNFKPKEIILRKWERQKEDLADYVSNEIEVIFNFILSLFSFHKSRRFSRSNSFSRTESI